MNVNKRLNYFRTGLVLVISLFLLNLFLPSSFSQNGGGVARAGEPAMLEISGKVVKTMSGGGYTYALVDKDGAKTWVALPKSNIAVGNEIACRPGMTMYNFPSTALNRTFEQIVFSQGLKSSSGAAAPPAATQPTDEAADVPKPKAKKPIDDWKGGF